MRVTERPARGRSTTTVNSERQDVLPGSSSATAEGMKDYGAEQDAEASDTTVKDVADLRCTASGSAVGAG
ncbi:MAG: hypothetical protein LH477_02730 [Nocardioides sp.]|nr:hypothetical protein [Nocardioides sp.]